MAQQQSSGSGSCLLRLLIGCGAMVFLLILFAMAGCMWLQRPGEQIATATIVGEDSIGAAELEDLAEDEGVEALLGVLMRELEARDSRHLPKWFPRQRRDAGDMNPMLPTSITITVEEIPGVDRPAFLAAINFRGWIRPFKFLFERFESTQDDPEYRGHRLVSADGDFFITFHEGTVLVSDRVEALRLAIDRIAGGAGAVTPARSLPPGALPAGDWDATGGLRNDSGRLDELLADLGGEEAGSVDLGTGAALGFGLDIESADRAHATVQVVGTPSASSETAAERLRQFAGDFESRLGQHVEVEATTRIEDGNAVLNLEILGLQDALIDALDRLDDFTDDFSGRVDEKHNPTPAEDPAPVSDIDGS